MNLGNLLQYYSWVVIFVVFVNGSRFRDAIARYRDRIDETVNVTATTEEDAVGEGTALGESTIPWDINRSSRNGDQFQTSRSEIETKLQQAETPEEYFKIFFPDENVDTIWQTIVNASYNPERVKDGTYGEYTREDSSRVIKEHIAQHMEEMSCSHPKPELIDMYDELNITRNRPVYIVPECTTLMRCHNGECCSKIKPCVPREGTRQTIWKTFLITEISLPGQNEIIDPAPRIRLVNYTFEEDTICDCLGPLQAPICELTCHDVKKRLNERDCACECITRCPYPYVQDDDTCTCECQDDDGDCKKIRRGKKPLKDAECRCVVTGKCHPPNCKRGYAFSTKLCRCDIKGNENSPRSPPLNQPERGTVEHSNGGGGGGRRRCATEPPDISDVNGLSSSDQSPGSQNTKSRNFEVNERTETDSSCEDEND